ncbi:hypothetical protein KC19_VG056300 [Ceratodon purpureus]|uniref:Uncharacterized protein n=1 Tax=Ceratodon purpureus TaxID=3225 RepID=A0A8T0HMB1_CERPU|nr:hypothetical protein KC19_VG056300 [Ceratodon purpureus]
MSFPSSASPSPWAWAKSCFAAARRAAIACGPEAFSASFFRAACRALSNDFCKISSSSAPTMISSVSSTSMALASLSSFKILEASAALATALSYRSRRASADAFISSCIIDLREMVSRDPRSVVPRPSATASASRASKSSLSFLRSFFFFFGFLNVVISS